MTNRFGSTARVWTPMVPVRLVLVLRRPYWAVVQLALDRASEGDLAAS